MITAERAFELATSYLIMNVGDLTGVDKPVFPEDGFWKMSVYRSNAFQGRTAEIGRISMDRVSGEIDFIRYPAPIPTFIPEAASVTREA